MGVYGFSNGRGFFTAWANCILLNNLLNAVIAGGETDKQINVTEDGRERGQRESSPVAVPTGRHLDLLKEVRADRAKGKHQQPKMEVSV